MDNDDVGYGKPPKQHQWKPGQSGNPRGRPRKPEPLISIDDAEILRRLDAEVIEIGGRSMTRREAEIRCILGQAVRNNKKATRLIGRLARTSRSRRGGVRHVKATEGDYGSS